MFIQKCLIVTCVSHVLIIYEAALGWQLQRQRLFFFFITDVYDSLVIDSTKTIIPRFFKISQYIAAMSKLIKMWSSMSNMSPRKFTCQCNTCHWILKQVSLPPWQILSHGRGMGCRRSGRRTSSDEQRVAVRIKCRHLCGVVGGTIMGIWPPTRLSLAA